MISGRVTICPCNSSRRVFGIAIRAQDLGVGTCNLVKRNEGDLVGVGGRPCAREACDMPPAWIPTRRRAAVSCRLLCGNSVG